MSEQYGYKTMALTNAQHCHRTIRLSKNHPAAIKCCVYRLMQADCSKFFLTKEAGLLNHDWRRQQSNTFACDKQRAYTYTQQ